MKILIALLLGLTVNGTPNDHRPGDTGTQDGGDWCPSWKFVPRIVCEDDYPCWEVLEHVRLNTGECWQTDEVVRVSPRLKFI
jgi:hypothetical protein